MDVAEEVAVGALHFDVEYYDCYGAEEGADDASDEAGNSGKTDGVGCVFGYWKCAEEGCYPDDYKGNCYHCLDGS